MQHPCEISTALAPEFRPTSATGSSRGVWSKLWLRRTRGAGSRSTTATWVSHLVCLLGVKMALRVSNRKRSSVAAEWTGKRRRERGKARDLFLSLRLQNVALCHLVSRVCSHRLLLRLSCVFWPLPDFCGLALVSRRETAHERQLDRINSVEEKRIRRSKPASTSVVLLWLFTSRSCWWQQRQSETKSRTVESSITGQPALWTEPAGAPPTVVDSRWPVRLAGFTSLLGLSSCCVAVDQWVGRVARWPKVRAVESWLALLWFGCWFCSPH